MQHPFSTSVIAAVTVGATSTQILAARSGRTYAVIVNDSNETMYLALGTAAVLNRGIRLNANGGTLEINGDKPFPGVIYGICASGGKNASTLDA